MHKIKLDADALAVESFETGDHAEGAGTGRGSEPSPQSAETE